MLMTPNSLEHIPPLPHWPNNHHMKVKVSNMMLPFILLFPPWYQNHHTKPHTNSQWSKFHWPWSNNDDATIVNHTLQSNNICKPHTSYPCFSIAHPHHCCFTGQCTHDGSPNWTIPSQHCHHNGTMAMTMSLVPPACFNLNALWCSILYWSHGPTPSSYCQLTW